MQNMMKKELVKKEIYGLSEKCNMDELAEYSGICNLQNFENKLRWDDYLKK